MRYNKTGNIFFKPLVFLQYFKWSFYVICRSSCTAWNSPIGWKLSIYLQQQWKQWECMARWVHSNLCSLRPSQLGHTGFLSSLLSTAAGIPYDGVPRNETVTVHVSVTVVLCIFATCGVFMTIAFLIFNLAARERMWVMVIFSQQMLYLF